MSRRTGKKFSSHNARVTRRMTGRRRSILRNGSMIPGMCGNYPNTYHMGGSNVMANYLTNRGSSQHKNLDTGEWWV